MRVADPASGEQPTWTSLAALSAICPVPTSVNGPDSAAVSDQPAVPPRTSVTVTGLSAPSITCDVVPTVTALAPE